MERGSEERVGTEPSVAPFDYETEYSVPSKKQWSGVEEVEG